MSDFDKSNTSALHWATHMCKTMRRNGYMLDRGWITGWFANYWAAVHDPLAAEIEQLKKSRATKNKTLLITIKRLGNKIKRLEKEVADATTSEYRSSHRHFLISSQIRNLELENKDIHSRLDAIHAELTIPIPSVRNGLKISAEALDKTKPDCGIL